MTTRKVGTESSKVYERYLKNGFFDKYMSGKGLDIGFAGYTPGVEPILSTAIGVDFNYPGYNGVTLPFEACSQDYVYSSHCLEHVVNYGLTIREWYRVIKPGGHIVIAVPHQYLYEKKTELPSNWNRDHNRFYTPGTLLSDIECALAPNSYRVRFLEDGDEGFDYSIPPEKHSGGQYEITVVIQKIHPPGWQLSRT